MAEFQPALALTLAHEGGFSDDPADPGGRTNRGITQRTYDAWCAKNAVTAGDVRNISLAEVAAIYSSEYWEPSRAGELIDQPVANKYFDLSVNMGLSAGCKLLQLACIDSGHAVTADGKIGPLTLLEANACEPTTLLDMLKHRAVAHYEQIAAARPSSAKFLKGWLARAMS